MVLVEVDWYMQKIETRPYLTPFTRMNSKWIKDLNISCDTINVLVENIGSKISDIPHSNIFADVSPRTRETTEKITNLYSIKLKSFYTAKEIINKIK